ncbi:AAA domain-containing protein [Verrucomicrobiales bacterium BCK34]|nr:AAA domain-containing protein [Verrucomicrobiales bacterium BCK34]
MNPASGILNFLAECYRENGSRVGVGSLESSRVKQSLIISGEDPVISRAVFDGIHFVPGKRAASLATQAQLYAKDRDLFFGAVFYIGKSGGETLRRKPTFAPLILYPATVATVNEDSGAEFSIETERCILNDALLAEIGSEEFVAKVEAAIETSGHNEGSIGELRRLFRDEMSDVETDQLLGYPHLLTNRELREIYTSVAESKSSPSYVLPGAVFFLADKSTEMRGVLNDLEEMAAPHGSPSEPVGEILGLGGGIAGRGGSKRKDGYIPASLSPAQEQISKSASTRPLTLAVGPPGTGKSFTIAALAIEAMSRGESVLIVSKMDHAVDVVADKIEESLGISNVCVRAGRKSYLKQLKSFLSDLLSGMYFDSDITGKAMKISAAELRAITAKIEKTEQALEKRSQREERRGDILSDPDPWFFKRWRQKRIRKHAADDDTVMSRLALLISAEVDQRIARTVSYLEKARGFYLNRALTSHRGTFQAFNKGIRARTTHKKEEYFQSVNWSGLLGALPVWLVNLSDLHRVIPLKRHLFDLVIIDEASQCDIASALPALHRAKRAVITGDPKQLRHVSFLSLASQADFACQFGLDESQLERFNFRKVSLVDLASGSIREQESVVFLNEHFRSRPGIISFSNEAFYSNKLAIMTGHRAIDRLGSAEYSVEKIGGARSDSGVNEAEIDAVFKALEKLAAPGGPALSIGILSPFRAQVDAILKRVEASPMLHLLLNRHDLLVGTAHSFQGEERDIMLLSLALDDSSPAASFRYLDKEDVFNVSITRARLENRVFVSFGAESKAGPLVRRFIAHAGEIERAHGVDCEESNRVKSSTQQGWSDGDTGNLLKALADRGFVVEESFKIGGYKVDFLCIGERISLAIDLIGFPGPHAEAMGLNRHLMLKRAGIQVFPIALSEWLVKPNRVLDDLDRLNLS